MEDNVSLEGYLIQIARTYAVKMNEIESRIFELAEADIESGKDYFDEYKKKYQPVFQQYATSKKRAYGGRADSYGRPTRYDGITEMIPGHATLKTKSRAEVYFETFNDFEAEYLFVLLKEDGEWKIDNVKYKWYRNPKWGALIM